MDISCSYKYIRFFILRLQSEHSMAIRDLTMQIEIANAQATEFEEAAQQLKQEIKDLGTL